MWPCTQWLAMCVCVRILQSCAHKLPKCVYVILGHVRKNLLCVCVCVLYVRKRPFMYFIVCVFYPCTCVCVLLCVCILAMYVLRGHSCTYFSCVCVFSCVCAYLSHVRFLCVRILSVCMFWPCACVKRPWIMYVCMYYLCVCVFVPMCVFCVRVHLCVCVSLVCVHSDWWILLMIHIEGYLVFL